MKHVKTVVTSMAALTAAVATGAGAGTSEWPEERIPYLSELFPEAVGAGAGIYVSAKVPKIAGPYGNAILGFVVGYAAQEIVEGVIETTQTSLLTKYQIYNDTTRAIGEITSVAVNAMSETAMDRVDDIVGTMSEVMEDMKEVVEEVTENASDTAEGAGSLLDGIEDAVIDFFNDDEDEDADETETAEGAKDEENGIGGLYAKPEPDDPNQQPWLLDPGCGVASFCNDPHIAGSFPTNGQLGLSVDCWGLDCYDITYSPDGWQAFGKEGAENAFNFGNFDLPNGFKMDLNNIQTNIMQKGFGLGSFG